MGTQQVVDRDRAKRAHGGQERLFRFTNSILSFAHQDGVANPIRPRRSCGSARAGYQSRLCELGGTAVHEISTSVNCGAVGGVVSSLAGRLCYLRGSRPPLDPKALGQFFGDAAASADLFLNVR